MTRPRSLRNRLALLALGVTAAWLVLLTIGFNLLLSHQLRSQADDVLRTRASAAVSTVEPGPGGRLTVRETQDDRAIDTGTWIFQGARVLERPRASARLQRAAERLAGTGPRFVQDSEAEDVRFYALPVLDGGRPVGTVVASLSLDPYQRTKELALLASAGLAALLLAAMYVSTRASVARALRPVAAMTEQASEWSAGDVARRFGPARRPLELDSLASNLDGLLDRLSAVLRHERHLSAEISHELRTPLSRIVAEADLLRSRTRDAEELHQAHDAIAADAEQLSNLLETLLSTARSTNGVLPGHCDVRLAVRQAVEQWSRPRTAGPRVRVVDSGADPGRTGVDEAVLARVLGPLLDNAARYADERVDVLLERSPAGPVVTVRDDGPGVPPGKEESVFEPGYRADATDGHDGAGLGLSLARRLARAGGGDLHALRVDRGAAFAVTLPPG